MLCHNSLIWSDQEGWWLTSADMRRGVLVFTVANGRYGYTLETAMLPHRHIPLVLTRCEALLAYINGGRLGAAGLDPRAVSEF